MLCDLRLALRQLRLAPAFSMPVILTVGPAIAAITTIFSLVDAELRARPFGQPERIVQVAEKYDRLPLASFSAPVPNFLAWRKQAKSLDGLAGVGFASYAPAFRLGTRNALGRHREFCWFSFDRRTPVRTASPQERPCSIRMQWMARLAAIQSIEYSP